MASDEQWQLSQDRCHVSLTHSPLHAQSAIDLVRSPSAGAIVLFAGTTRDNFAGKPVKNLHYTAYHSLALRSMLAIARAATATHALHGVAITHRLGDVPIGEESILIAVSAAHRTAAWRAGEEVLERCKEGVEVWKREDFEGGEGVWRANVDSVPPS